MTEERICRWPEMRCPHTFRRTQQRASSSLAKPCACSSSLPAVEGHLVCPSHHSWHPSLTGSSVQPCPTAYTLGSPVPCGPATTTSGLLLLLSCFPTGLRVLVLCEGEMSALLSMITESWTKELRQIQSAALFHRLDLERVISSMQTQVLFRF